MADAFRAQVKADIAAGRLWKARDRLQGARRMSPSNQWILDQLGEVLFRMGDLPEAGRIWFLSARTGPDWEAAEAAFYDRYGRKPQNIVGALAVKGTIQDYPIPVQDRLRDLQQKLRADGRFWEPRAKPSATAEVKNRLTGVFYALISMLLLAALGIGLYNIVLYFIRIAHSV